MNIIKFDRETAILSLSKDEIGVLSNSINEICNGIEVWEFETRIGATIEEMREHLKFLSIVYEKMNSSE